MRRFQRARTSKASLYNERHENYNYYNVQYMMLHILFTYIIARFAHWISRIVYIYGISAHHSNWRLIYISPPEQLERSSRQQAEHSSNDEFCCCWWISEQAAIFHVRSYISTKFSRLLHDRNAKAGITSGIYHPAQNKSNKARARTRALYIFPANAL